MNNTRRRADAKDAKKVATRRAIETQYGLPAKSLEPVKPNFIGTYSFTSNRSLTAYQNSIARHPGAGRNAPRSAQKA